MALLAQEHEQLGAADPPHNVLLPPEPAGPGAAKGWTHRFLQRWSASPPAYALLFPPTRPYINYLTDVLATGANDGRHCHHSGGADAVREAGRRRWPPSRPIDLGAAVIREVVARSKAPKERVGQVIMGTVIPAGLGQIPARQAAFKAGLPVEVPGAHDQ